MDDLKKWLVDCPFDFGPSLAARAIYRVFPQVFSPTISRDWLRCHGPKIFHAIFVLATTVTFPIKGHKHSARIASDLNLAGALTPDLEAYFSSALRAAMSSLSANQKHEKIDFSISAIRAIEDLVRGKRTDQFNDGNFYEFIEKDKNVLQLGNGRRNADTRRLLSSPLFAPLELQKWKESIERSRNHFSDVVGSELLFDLVESAGTFAQPSTRINFVLIANRFAAQKVIAELDPHFWGRPFDEIEGDLRYWADLDGHDRAVETIPSQNRNAMSFLRTFDGKIKLDLSPLDIDEPRDQEWSERFAEVLEIAERLADDCRVSNSAKRLEPFLRAYLHSTGGSPDAIKGSLFVQRGERLRQQLVAYETRDTFLPPLPDEILLDLRAWRSAHNLFVGLDRELLQKDILQFGPDNRRPSAFSPREIRALAQAAEEENLLEDGVAEVLREAADLAPEVPEIGDRRTIWSTETSRNLVIEAFEIALRNPGKTAAGFLVLGAAGVSAGVAGSIVGVAAGSLPAARFLMKNRSWVEIKLGESPTWKGLFLDLCEWLEKEVKT